MSFNTSVGTPSNTQTITISGSNLLSGINVTAGIGFEVSLTPTSGFATQVNIAPNNGSLSSTTIFVRFNPLTTGITNGTVLVSATGANNITYTLSGTANNYTYAVCNDVQVWNASSIYVQNNEVNYEGKKYKAKWYNHNQLPGSSNDPWEFMSTCVFSTIDVSATLSNFSTLLGTPSITQTFVVSGTNLISNIEIIAPSQFEVSTDNSVFSSRVVLVPQISSVPNTTIYTRYNPSSVGNHSGNIEVGTTGLPKQYIAVQGSGSSSWTVNGNLMYSNPTITNIGIGTQNVPSGYILGVNGKIITKGMKVQFTGWADTVFQENYKLPDLNELEQYVRENKHLPEFPSEKEVLQNGMAIEDMNVLLLKKIEELTLLLIEQNKKIETLERQLFPEGK